MPRPIHCICSFFLSKKFLLSPLVRGRFFWFLFLLFCCYFVLYYVVRFLKPKMHQSYHLHTRPSALFMRRDEFVFELVNGGSSIRLKQLSMWAKFLGTNVGSYFGLPSCFLERQLENGACIYDCLITVARLIGLTGFNHLALLISCPVACLWRRKLLVLWLVESVLLHK